MRKSCSSASYLDERKLTYEPTVLEHFQLDDLNVVKGLIFSLLRFGALIILFQEKHFATL